MSIQLVKPGERAECHRHTAAALRFVVESDGTGYTNVEGEQMLMEPGDLVLTPNWTWHDHFNCGKKNLVWLDVLDAPLTNHLDATFHENFAEGPSQPIVKPEGYGKQQYGAIRPRMTNATNAALPYNYKWRDAERALNEIAASGHRDPHDGVLLEYSHPITGGPTMPTIGCWVQMIPPGESTTPHRHTSSTIYHVVQGAGVTTVGKQKGDGKQLGWGAHDCFFVPSWTWHSIRKQIDEGTGDYFFGHRPAGAGKLGLIQGRSGVRRYGVGMLVGNERSAGLLARGNRRTRMSALPSRNGKANSTGKSLNIARP